MKKSSISNKRINLVVMFFVLITLVGCQNNSNSDISADLPKVVGNFPLKEQWRKSFDSELKAVALGSGVLITGIADNNGAIIQAFDISTGSILWKSELSGNSIGIHIVVVDKSVYIIYAPKLYAMDLGTGKLIFETDIQASNIDQIAAISGEHIFVTKVSEGVYAYDRSTGKPSWQILFGRGNTDVFLETTRDLNLIIHGEYLKVVNEKDGNLAWQSQIGLHGPIGYYDGVLYYSNSKVKEEPDTQIEALDLGTRSRLWVNKLGNKVDCMAIENNDIITITTQTIAIVDPKSGEKIWDYYIPLGVYCPPVIMGGVIYIKDGSNNQVIAIQRENGNILGRLDFEDSGGIVYKIPKDNLLVSTNPFPVLAFYLKYSVYVYK